MSGEPQKWGNRCSKYGYMYTISRSLPVTVILNKKSAIQVFTPSDASKEATRKRPDLQIFAIKQIFAGDIE